MELNPEGVNEENSQSTEVCVSVIERETGKVLKGEEAPSSAELSIWLEPHPALAGKLKKTTTMMTSRVMKTLRRIK
ncbi:unnamed protein product [Orchesella dallaii]|uniref:BRK domain-containing protein n=1 Tax=Orchesella dallaii TaxID=48710 RepID=A0ABP1QPF0_9HEXA